jgi:hypothetical protein
VIPAGSEGLGSNEVLEKTYAWRLTIEMSGLYLVYHDVLPPDCLGAVI